MGDANNQQFTMGYVFVVGIGVISWICKKQSTIALSTMEGEYMATSHCTRKAVWLRQLLADVGYLQERASSIMCEYQGCITLARTPTHHSHTKHIDIQHHFYREKLKYQEICLKYYPTKDMIADLLTKPLAKNRHQASTNAMN